MKTGLIYKIYPKKTIEKIDDKIKMLGVSGDFTVRTFLINRLILTALVFGLCLFLKYGYILAPFIALAFYILFEYLVLDYYIKKRGKKLEREALFFFEVLTLTLEGGRSLRHAISLTVDNIESEISLEFKKMLDEVSLGKSLNEGLESMKKRIPSDTINNAILNMIEANTYGNRLIDVMYNQIEFLRNKQMLNVKALIAKLPTKISVISVIFFIPIMLLIILGPILVKFIMK